MLYWNTPPSIILNLVLYPRSTLGGKIISVLGSIQFNGESMEIRSLHDVTPKKPPLVVVKFIYRIIFPHVGNEIKCLNCSRRWLCFSNIWWKFDNELLEGSDMTNTVTISTQETTINMKILLLMEEIYQ